MLSLMETIIFLKGVSIFREVDGEGLRFLAEKAEERVLEAGSIVCQENEMGDEMYIIKKGKVEIYRGAGLTKSVIATLGEKSFFGEMAILEDAPRSASVKTLEDTTLIVIRKESFREAILEYPRIAFEALRVLSQRLREANAKLNS